MRNLHSNNDNNINSAFQLTMSYVRAGQVLSFQAVCAAHLERQDSHSGNDESRIHTLLSDSVVLFVTTRLCKDVCYTTNKECCGLTAASASLNKETEPSRLDIKRAWPRAVLE